MYSGRRAVSPVVSAALLVAIVVALAVAAGAFLLGGFGPPEAGSPAGIDVVVDVEDDQIKVTYVEGEPLHSDRIRIVWTVDGTGYTSDPTGTEEKLEPGESVTFTFDGATGAQGGWTAYGSPGVVDIAAGDEVTVTLYDTDSENAVAKRSLTADGTGSVAAASHAGELIWMHDPTAGASGVEMEVRFEIQPGSPTIGNSLNSVEIDIGSGSPDMFTGTDQADVVTLGVDTDGDGTVDDDISGDVDAWTVSDGGSTLKVGLSGAAYTNPQAGEVIVLVVEDVDNPPSPGTYDAEVQTSGDGNWQSGSLNIS